MFDSTLQEPLLSPAERPAKAWRPVTDESPAVRRVLIGVALLGLAVVFRLHPGWFAALKVFGGFYLLWFAWRLWAASSRPLPPAASGSRGFFGGIALNLSNPKPALFYAALILSVFPAAMSGRQQATLYAICLTTELFWYALVAVLMSTAAMRARYFAAKFWIDRAASLAMAALGILLIVKH